MPSQLDSRLENAFTRFTSENDSTPNTIDSNEASSLIKTAEEINKEGSRFFGLVSNDKGQKQLSELFDRDGQNFNPLARAMVDEFVTTGRKMDSRLVNNFRNFTANDDVTPGRIDRNEAMKLIGYANAVNRENSLLGILQLPVGTDELGRLLSQAGSTFDPKARALVNNFVQGKQTATKIMDWKAEKPTWHCHWFPMKESRPNGGDTINNLYAPGGVLSKYDEAFGTDSRAYELKNNFRPHDSTSSDADWAGHCNNASEVAALLKEPKYAVTYNGVTFSPQEIAGLLVKVSSSLSERVDFEGRRYNNFMDDKGDPSPHDFLEKVLKAWGSDAANPIPFVLDIDREEQVWNYPYDQGKVFELSQPPAGTNLNDIPRGGSVTFYEAQLKGTTFEDQARQYQFWIQRNDNGDVLKSGWIKGPDANINPDFAWRPHPVGDLSQKESWVTKPRKQSNPYVKAEEVYEIYARSLDKNYDSFVSRAGRWFDGLF